MRHTLTLLTALTLVALAPDAMAQQAIDQDPGAHSNHAAQSASRTDGDEVPYAGRDLAYDYLTNEYYTYTGPEPKDRRADEQDGYRTGVLHTQRSTYRPRSRYGYSGCGCAAYVSHNQTHDYRQLDERRAPY